MEAFRSRAQIFRRSGSDAHKWSRPDLVEQISNYFRTGNEYERWALEQFELRKAKNSLPAPRDPQAKVAQFTDVGYAKHRYNPKV